MTRTSTSAIKDFHAHIYFDADQVEKAQALAARVRDAFDIAIGRFHTNPVGPHPRGSCQLTVGSADFGPFAAWLALNRSDLTVFAHPNTGDDLADHTDHVIWFGPSEELVIPPEFRR
jgi:aromatic ring-cleaving dioxygenase